MWAAGDEPVFKDIIKSGYTNGVTHCHFLPCELETKVKEKQRKIKLFLVGSYVI